MYEGNGIQEVSAAMTLEEFRLLAEEAFPSVILHAQQLAFGSTKFDEIVELQSLAGRDWRSLTPAEAFTLHGCLEFFTPAGARAFLPALLVAAYDVEEADVLVDFLLSWLVSPGVAGRGGQLDGLSYEQRRIVCYWLEHIGRLADEKGTQLVVERALRVVWKC